MHIWLKTNERHKVDPRVTKEGIDENPRGLPTMPYASIVTDAFLFYAI